MRGPVHRHVSARVRGRWSVRRPCQYWEALSAAFAREGIVVLRLPAPDSEQEAGGHEVPHPTGSPCLHCRAAILEPGDVRRSPESGTLQTINPAPR